MSKGEILDFSKKKPVPAPTQEAAPKMRFEPIEDYVLIQPAIAKTMTQAGIIVPDSSKKNPPYGQVITVGPGRPDVDHPMIVAPMPVEKGDTVMYGEHAGDVVELNGNTYLLMRASMIFGRIIVEKAEDLAKIEVSAEPRGVSTVVKDYPQE
jgi:chaperonin GroES